MRLHSTKSDIKEFDKDKLTEWLKRSGIDGYRSGQILKWIYSRQADSFDAMTDLSKKVRSRLMASFDIRRLEKVRTELSRDGTRKYLFKLHDGKHIETVLIPERGHATLCISSQVGCAQGCRFCMTAKGGFERNLTAGEIIAQVRDIMADTGNSARLTNIVFMGMGEPLANYHSVVQAVKTITDSDFGLKFSRRRVTLSTAGLVSRLPDLGRDTDVRLAVSLNATDNRTRNFLMPVNKRYPIESVLSACRRYPLKRGDRITFEYILIKGVNDSEADAVRLTELLTPVRAKVNLIPFNPHDGSEFRCPERSEIERFQEILLQKKYTAIIRSSKGSDISAACGQLRANVIHTV
jgi:23S rRNA (adenine2503-C2)-methyltransferase